MKWKLGNQLGLFRSSASGLADVRPLAAGQARILRCRHWRPQLAKKNAGLAGGASPSPEVDALRLAIHMCSVRITARSWPAQM